MPLLTIAITFFIIANPIGNSPSILALIKDFDFEKQKKIMFRESIFALLIAIFFQYFGRMFLTQLGISDYTLGISGGVLLFLVGLTMIFPPHTSSSKKTLKQDPMIVPIATPLIAGPSLLTVIMAYSKLEANNLKITLAILLAWVGVTTALVSAPYLQKLFGNRGMTALEQLMGLLLILMATEMTVQGLTKFIVAINLN